MLIAVEGPDLAGKSTLCAEASRNLGIVSFAPWADLQHAQPALTSVSRTLLDLSRQTAQPFLSDRFIISELCYGPLLGRKSDYIWSLLDEWSSLDMLSVVLILPNHEVLRERYRQRGDSMHTLDMILRVSDEYRSISKELSARFPLKVIETGDVEAIRAALA